jgi:uncharacterized protein YkwD
MDIRTWQEADRPDLPEPGFDDDSLFPGAADATSPGPARLHFGTRDGESGTDFTAADVISLGPAVRPGPRGGRSLYSARHRSARSPFSPLRPAPIAIGSLSTAAIAAFAFVGPGILHGGDAASTTPVLDGMPHRIAPLTPGSDASTASTSADPVSGASASSPVMPSTTATGAKTVTAPASSAGGPAGHTGGSAPSGQGSPTGPGPGHQVTPPSSTPSQPPTAPPSIPPSQPPAPPWGPISPPSSPTPPITPTPPPSLPVPPPISTPAPPVFNASAAVSSALTEISHARASLGAETLSVDPVLVRAAAKHNGDMVHTGRFSHTGSDGSSPYSRAQSLGCWTLSQELIARGRPGDDVVGALLKNSQSRPALLSYLNAAVGISAQQDPKTGDVYWTIELAWL